MEVFEFLLILCQPSSVNVNINCDFCMKGGRTHLGGGGGKLGRR